MTDIQQWRDDNQDILMPMVNDSIYGPIYFGVAKLSHIGTQVPRAYWEYVGAAVGASGEDNTPSTMSFFPHDLYVYDSTEEHSPWAMRLSLVEYCDHFKPKGDPTVTLLIPDRSREQREDFVWCIPIDRAKWTKWYELSITFKTITPEAHSGMHYINRMEGRQVRTIMMLPSGTQSDADVLQACAYLRMVKGMTCRMYVIRCTDDPVKGTAALINAVAGTDPKLMDNVEEDELPIKPKDTDNTPMAMIGNDDHSKFCFEEQSDDYIYDNRTGIYGPIVNS